LKIAERNDILNLAEIFLDAKPELRKFELFAKPPKKGLPSPIHQDNFYWCIVGANALTLWIALDAGSAANGGLTYYSGSHKLGLVDHINSYAPGSSQKVPEDKFIDMEAVTPSVQPGDILIHHSLTFHGSDANVSDKSRRGLTMQFKDIDAAYDQKMLDHYNKNLDLQVNIRDKS
jgi:ectoine hydroxylase-related dioxygenase (phytanoyl-CoA dioxygenase family)